MLTASIKYNAALQNCIGSIVKEDTETKTKTTTTTTNIQLFCFKFYYSRSLPAVFKEWKPRKSQYPRLGKPWSFHYWLLDEDGRQAKQRDTFQLRHFWAKQWTALIQLPGISFDHPRWKQVKPIFTVRLSWKFLLIQFLNS